MDEGVNQRLDIPPVPERLFTNAMLESMTVVAKAYGSKIIRLLAHPRSRAQANMRRLDSNG
jgi:hypothetical protein